MGDVKVGKRIAIVGTANSWRDTPWDDPTLEIWGLNDAYTLGFPRCDRWYELHPIDHFYFRPLKDRVVYADDVPHGYYVRPQGHLEWLQQAAKTIPVFLQSDPPAGWPPNAQRFPREAVTQAFGTYWASGPAYEVAHAILEGASEIHVYGIHLSTEAEYREQRPQFEHMLGIARGRGIKIVMATSSPVLKHGWQYGYEPKPAMHPAKVKLMHVRHAKGELAAKLVTMPASKQGPARDRLRRLEAMEMDCLQRMQNREPVRITAPVFQIGA
mgnify:CR=1 FL=1